MELKKSTGSIPAYDNLNKENLWNELYEKYPKQTQVFCDWVDSYKKHNHWNMLFNSNSDYQNADGKNAVAPKFHELPFAFQMGMWFEFVCQGGDCQYEIPDPFSFELQRDDITEYIKNIEVD